MNKSKVVKELIKIAEQFEKDDQILLSNAINLTMMKLSEKKKIALKLQQISNSILKIDKKLLMNLDMDQQILLNQMKNSGKRK